MSNYVVLLCQGTRAQTHTEVGVTIEEACSLDCKQLAYLLRIITLCCLGCRAINPLALGALLTNLRGGVLNFGKWNVNDLEGELGREWITPDENLQGSYVPNVAAFLRHIDADGKILRLSGCLSTKSTSPW